MGPIGDVIQIMAATVGIVGLVLREQITIRRRSVRVAGSIDRTWRGRTIAPIAMLPMMRMPIVLQSRRDTLILRRLAVRKYDHKCPTAGHNLRTGGPWRSMVLSKRIRVSATGIRDISGRARFSTDQCRYFTCADRTGTARGKIDPV